MTLFPPLTTIQPQPVKRNITTNNNNKPKPPSQNRYQNGFRWCGRCGEWFKMKQENLDKANRCPWCHYMLRRDALLKAKRRPTEVHYH